jgi:hypothetical protein
MRKTNRTSNRPSSSPLHLLEFGPDGDWYSRYWLEDKPRPDLAFLGRPVAATWRSHRDPDTADQRAQSVRSLIQSFLGFQVAEDAGS